MLKKFRCIINITLFKLDGSIVLDVFINDVKLNVKVFPSDSIRADNLDDYVKAKPIAKHIGVEVFTDAKSDTLIFESEKYGNTEYPLEGNSKIINNNLYIQFSVFEGLTKGSMKQEEYSAIYLYTGDYERTDLPNSVEECYVMLDEYLTEEEISLIKNMTQDELEMERYTLGVWIRDNWLYPRHSKLPVLFDEYGIWSKDKMAKTILEGYYKYLNGLPCSLEDLMNE